MLAIWPLIPWPFLNPAWTSGSSWFMYCWSLAWKILSISLLASVQLLSHVWLFETPWTTAHQASLSINQLPEFTQTHVYWVSDAIQPSHLLSSPFPPALRVFSNESVLCIRWPKYWSFSFNISPSNEHSGLISFRMDWLDPLQSKGLSSVFSNNTVQKHQFFGAQLSL